MNDFAYHNTARRYDVRQDLNYWCRADRVDYSFFIVAVSIEVKFRIEIK